MTLKEKFLKLIWNISLVCPWNCNFCCTNAVQVIENKDTIFIKEYGDSSGREIKLHDIDLEETSLKRLTDNGVKPNVFDMALWDRQKRGLELTYQQKIKVLCNIFPMPAKIDFGGGDPLSCYENFLILQEAARLFGKENISVTSTGASLNRYDLNDITSIINIFEFTFDEPINNLSSFRPSGYNRSNIMMAKKFSKLNINTRAQIPLHPGNIEPSNIKIIYETLHNADIDEILLMRVFPVGRGFQNYPNQWFISRKNYLSAINLYRELENQYKYPKVTLQCALKYLENCESLKNPCDLMQNSFGISQLGMLLISAWATDLNDYPINDIFVLGNLSEKKFEALVKTNMVDDYSLRLDENFGHCKIFSFLFSTPQDADALFKKADPLYV